VDDDDSSDVFRSLVVFGGDARLLVGKLVFIL
jgi:hypothetical protein